VTVASTAPRKVERLVGLRVPSELAVAWAGPQGVAPAQARPTVGAEARTALALAEGRPAVAVLAEVLLLAEAPAAAGPEVAGLRQAAAEEARPAVAVLAEAC
jgi:hypothetical protein